jgi:hypothetical protein
MKRLGLVVMAVAMAGLAQAGFFRVEQRDGRWWLLDQDGKPFLAKAVNCVDAGVTPDKFNPKNPAYCALKFYPTDAAWAAATATRLKGWGFNTIGGYSDEPIVRGQGMPYTVALVMGGWFGIPWVDIRDPESVKKLEGIAATEAAKVRDDPLCIGYFLDNELGWWDETAFLYWMGRPGTERLKQVLWGMLKEAYRGDLRACLRDFVVEPTPKTFADLQGELKVCRWAPGRRPVVVERFIGTLADDYYDVTTAALRKADPNHLILGDRYLSFYAQPVARAAGRHVDVVTTNYNTFAASGWILPSYFDTLYRITGKPIMVTEYYFASMENQTGNKNQSGPFMVVPTRRERAAGAREMTERLWRLPYLVGAHWFQFADEPPLGRDDGEDFAFGLVDNQDRPYEDLTAAFADVNGKAEALHREGPKADGLVPAAGGWRVPRATWTRSIDGKLDDWNLPATWVPAPGARAPFEPFGDFHLAWSPDGLFVAAVMSNFSDGGGAPEGPLDLERLALVVRRKGAAPLEIQMRGLHEKVGPEPVAGADGKKPADQRPLAPLTVLKAAGRKLPPGAEGITGAQSHVSITSLAEVFVPVSALGGKPLAAGETLRVGLSLRLRGDVKETFWPVSLVNGPRPSADGRLGVPADAGTPAAGKLAEVTLADGAP